MLGYPQIFRTVRAQAQMACTLLNIAILPVVCGAPFGCALLDSLAEWSQQDLILEREMGLLLEHRTHDGDKSLPVSISRAELSKILHTPRLSDLMGSLYNIPGEESCVPVPVQEYLRSAARHLARASHETDPSDRLLAAITAIEILMTANIRGDRGFESLEKRLPVLVGTDSLAGTPVKDILKARHHYVHKGHVVTSAAEDISSKALILASLVLINFANLAVHLRPRQNVKKDALRQMCIDFIDFQNDLLPHLAPSYEAYVPITYSDWKSLLESILRKL